MDDEGNIVNCDAGNIKRILMANEVDNHYLICPNKTN